MVDYNWYNEEEYRLFMWRKYKKENKTDSCFQVLHLLALGPWPSPSSGCRSQYRFCLHTVHSSRLVLKRSLHPWEYLISDLCSGMAFHGCWNCQYPYKTWIYHQNPSASQNSSYQPSSLSTIEPIDHLAYRPSSLSTINHRAYWPSSLSTIKPINHWAYQPSSLSTSGLLSRLFRWQQNFFLNLFW